MLKANKKKRLLHLNCFNAIYTSEKKLDIRKLKLLLNGLGFNPVSAGTLYIIEELEFFYNNNILKINYLNEAYTISAKLEFLNENSEKYGK